MQVGSNMESPVLAMSHRLLLVCIAIFSVSRMSVEASEAAVTDYKRGYAGRVEYIKAVITQENLDSGTRPNEAALKFFRKLVANGKNDIAGQLIPRRLGGTGTETYNIAPMNERVKTSFYKMKVEDPIYHAVSGGRQVVLEVWPRYEGKQATRPNRFDVNASGDDGTAFVDKITIVNPTS